jgi:hypothetical protein
VSSYGRCSSRGSSSARILTIAYLIRAHHRPTQLARLVRRLARAGASFYIHVSAQTSAETYGAMRAGLDGAANVHWTPRVKTHYGGFSLLEATLVGLAEIGRADLLPDYTIMLTGQDYPLKTADAIHGFFEDQAGKSFMRHFALPSDDAWRQENGGLDRIRYWHFEKIAYRTRQLRIPFVKRRFPRGFQPYGGSALWALSADCLRYVNDFVAKETSFVRFFRHVFIPDETFFPTIILNSPLRETIVNDELHYVEWPGGARPATLGSDAFPKLIASPKLFARKFDVEYDSRILDMLDRHALAAGS